MKNVFSHIFVTIYSSPFRIWQASERVVSNEAQTIVVEIFVVPEENIFIHFFTLFSFYLTFGFRFFHQNVCKNFLGI